MSSASYFSSGSHLIWVWSLLSQIRVQDVISLHSASDVWGTWVSIMIYRIIAKTGRNVQRSNSCPSIQTVQPVLVKSVLWLRNVLYLCASIMQNHKYGEIWMLMTYELYTRHFYIQFESSASYNWWVGSLAACCRPVSLLYINISPDTLSA